MFFSLLFIWKMRYVNNTSKKEITSETGNVVLHERKHHVTKKEKQREQGVATNIESNQNAARLVEYRKKYPSSRETSHCWVEGSGGGEYLRISLLCDDDDETARIIMKLEDVIAETKDELRNERRLVHTYEDVYNNIDA